MSNTLNQNTTGESSCSPQELLNLIESFSKLSIAVVGEGILDGYVYGSPRQLCREAPVPVIAKEHCLTAPGGAANTALNVRRLGAEVSFLTVLGKDQTGEMIRDILAGQGIKTDKIIFDPEREITF